jgi:Smg protein
MYEVLAYVYEHYERTDLASNGDHVARKLSAAGFERGDIHTALHWLAGMRSMPTRENVAVPALGAAQRILAPRELDKLDAACRGFLLTLERSGVLGAQTREQVLERVLAAGGEPLMLAQLKMIVLMVLWDQGLPSRQLLAHDLFLTSESQLPS